MAHEATSSVKATPQPAPTIVMDMPRTAADRFARAIAAREYVEIFSALARDARFRYLIPPGPGQVDGAADVAAKFLEWFGDADVLRIESILVQPLTDRTSLRYRFLLHEQDGWKEVEQQLYVDVDEGGLISSIDLLCSGFRPVDTPRAAGSSERPHRFDAGTLGCADGLAQEFRRRVLAIPVGDLLLVETSDPAAKEDLPPLARMMGHTVRSVEPSGDGRLLITVERGR
jgi:TusA-related sulfurtransferase